MLDGLVKLCPLYVLLRRTRFVLRFEHANAVVTLIDLALEPPDPRETLVLLRLELQHPLVAGRKVLFELTDPSQALAKIALELHRQGAMVGFGLLKICDVASD